MNVRITPISEDHIDQILTIENKVHVSPWSRNLFQQEIHYKGSVFLVFIKMGIIIGYGGFWDMVDTGHISNIAVHPGLQGKGVGRFIMSVLIKSIVDIGLNRVSLEVRSSNKRAIDFYERFGLIRDGQRPHYYSNGEQAYIYSMEI